MPYISSQEESSVFHVETPEMQRENEASFVAYRRRMRYLERRFERYLSLKGTGKVPKRNLSKDYEEGVEVHKQFGEYPYIWGHIDEYPENEWKESEYSIFVHNRLIRMRPTGNWHDTSVFEINQLIFNAFTRAGVEENIFIQGTADLKIMNLLGCHSIFNKQPDSQFRLRDRSIQAPSPFLVLEVAVHNEGWREIYYQAAAYLYVFTQIHYYMAIKFFPDADEFKMSIVLVKRRAPLLSYASNQEREDRMADFADLIELERPTVETRAQENESRKRFCTVGPTNKQLSNEWTRRQIEDFFDFEIVFHVDVDQSSYERNERGFMAYAGENYRFPFPTSTIIRGAERTPGISIEAFPEEIILVFTNDFFNAVYDLFIIDRMQAHNQ